jgi:hypothetical protein
MRENIVLKLYTEKQKSLIVNNIVNACKDIEKLNSTGYKFIYLASGFIAHYNLAGFKSYYSENNLKNDILEFSRFNQWNNFTPKDQNYDYYMQKKQIYNSIIERIISV